MDFRRPVVIDRENSGANSVGSSARNGPVGTGSSSSAAQLSESASSAMDARKEARILALKKQVPHGLTSPHICPCVEAACFHSQHAETCALSDSECRARVS